MDLLLLFAATTALALYAWVSLAPDGARGAYTRFFGPLAGRRVDSSSPQATVTSRARASVKAPPALSDNVDGAAERTGPGTGRGWRRGAWTLLATEPIPALRERTALTRGLLLSYGCGIAASLFCAAMSAQTVAAQPLAAQTWWFSALAILVAAVVLPRWKEYPAHMRTALSHIPTFDVAAIAALCLASLLLRLPKLDTLIPFVHGDEAACGIYGRLFNNGHAPLLSIGWYGLPMLSYAIPGLGLRLFGDTLHGLRLTNVCIGTCGIVLTYLLGRELFGRRAALLAGATLTLAFLDIDLSRDGIHYIQAPTAITLSLYLLARWLRRGGVVMPLLGGMSLAISLQVYFSARIVFPIVIALLLLVALFDPALRRVRLHGVPWVVLGCVIAVLPLIALFRANPGSFAERQDQVSILKALPDPAALAALGYSGQSALTIIWTQVVATLSTFYGRGDASTQIGWTGSMIDTVSALLLPFALTLCIARARRWPYALCLLWFCAVLAAGILTIDPPWWPRLMAMLPAIALMLGATLDAATGWAARRTGRPLGALAGLAVLLAMVAIVNMRVMFVEYPAASQSVPRRESTIVGLFLARVQGAGQTILVSDGFFDLQYEPIKFLAPRADGCTVQPNQTLSACAAMPSPRVYIFLPGRVKDLQTVRQARPGGRVVSLGDASVPMFAYLPPPS